MRSHRFYVGSKIELKHDFWLQDERLIHQWRNVLRLRTGDQVVLFDGQTTERLYEISELTAREAHLKLVTEYERKLPKRPLYLLWALLKKDKNDWVLQKCTELGVSHFVPLLVDRSEKTGFNEERAHKIVIEAAEQCGRSDVPTVRQPIHIETVLTEFKNKITLYICEQDGVDEVSVEGPAGVLIGPEGGWSDKEKQLFKEHRLKHLNLHDFTLRAETAAISACLVIDKSSGSDRR